jgi:glutathione S-transferase
MAEYQLHCLGESGNCFKVAQMLTLTGRDWEPVFVDLFKGETRGERFRADVNPMGEVPVLVHRGRRMTQSGALLDYLVGETGQFGWKDDEERREILRWILFDNHKFTSYYATLRFLVGLTHTGDPAVIEFLRGRALGAFGVVDKHVATQPFLVGGRPTIADLSLTGYLWYTEKTGIDLGKFPNLLAWRDRVSALPGWKPPYELMPRGLGGLGG